MGDHVQHLCVLVHGLWGQPIHLDYLKKTLQEQYPDDGLHILVPKSNANSFTYDGIEVGGERITNEIEQTIRDLEQDGLKVGKISITGYSLGGLVARYAIGLLYKSGVFEDVKPVNFTTFATPHLGVRTPKLSYMSNVYNVMGARTLSTSGQQMFLVDDFRDSGKALLELLADPNSVFMKGLSMFKNKSLYANTTNDRSVPYYTAAISKTDPFHDLEAIDVHHLDGQPEAVLLEPAHPVSLRKNSDAQELTAYERWASYSQSASKNLPFYAFFFTALPIAVPAFLLNSVYQSYRSAERVRLHESGMAGINQGRYRIPLLEETQHMQDQVYERLADMQTQEYLPTPPPESANASGRSSPKPDDSLVRTKTSEGGFKILALTPQQFQMIENLDRTGITKYRAHIQQHRYTHAAIVVRTDREGFKEGKVVVAHWARNFEI